MERCAARTVHSTAITQGLYHIQGLLVCYQMLGDLLCRRALERACDHEAGKMGFVAEDD